MASTVPLSKPLLTHSGEVSELILRELTAADIVAVKQSPFKVTVLPDKTTVVEQRYDVLMTLGSRLSGVDDLVLGKLSAPDFHKLTNAVIEEWNANSGE